MKKALLLLLMLSSFSYAQQSQAALIAAISANPALLDSPQAKAEMAKRGISKNAIMKKLNTPTEESPSLEDNNISSIDKNETMVINDNSSVNNEATTTELIFKNPIKYKENEIILKAIRKDQNRITSNKLERFSKTFFTNKNKLNPSLLSVPSYYIVNKNDTISIWVYGGVNKNIEALVDTNGNINIDTLGPIKVAGLEYKELKKILNKKLSKAFGDAKIAVNISELSTIQVTLTGHVNGIGVYNIASLSTLKDLLIESGGVKENGSIRNITISRDDKTIENIDFYELLLGQKTTVNTLLRNGDTVFIPQANTIVQIDGSVNNPALYELKRGEKLDKLIEYAGGLKASASKVGIKIQSFKKQKIITNTINFNDAQDQAINHEDKVYIYDIDSIHKDSVTLYGNLVRPGSREAKKTLNELLDAEINDLGLKGVFLENTLFSYAIVKSMQKNLTQKIKKFNLADVISGNEIINLNKDDEVYIFNKLDTEINQFVEIFGEVVTKQGQFQYYDGLTAYDLIKMAGTSQPYDLDKIKITSYNTPDQMPEIKIISLEEAQNFQLTPYDVIDLYNYYEFKQINTVNIFGQVYLEGEYTLNKNMTLQEIIEIAGGVTEKAYLQKCEIVRYSIIKNERVKKIINVDLTKSTPIRIQAHDEITIRAIPNWSKRQTVKLKGEVKFPGIYVIENGDRLSDVIQRAGGYSKQAFLYGAVFTRESIKKLQQQKLKEAILKLKQKALTMSTAPRAAGQVGDMDTMKIAGVIDSLSKEAERLQPIGRVSIMLEKDLDAFKNKPYNLILKDKDTLTIPSFNDTVLVMGQVMNPTAIVFNGKDDTQDYIKKAGGLTSLANSDEIYIIRANGESYRYDTGFFSSNVESKKGDVIVVSQKIITTSGMQITKDVSDILYKLAITTASLVAVGVL